MVRRLANLFSSLCVARRVMYASFLLIISLIRDMTEGDPIPFLYVPFIALGIFGSIYSLTLYFRRKKEIDDYNHGYYYGQKPPT